MQRIDTGDTIHSLKMYMYVTNEYGKPSARWIDLFVDSFRFKILNGEFPKYNIRKSEFDSWWVEIKQDLADRNMSSLASFTGGYDWFKAVGTAVYALGTADKANYRKDRQAFINWLMGIN